MRVNLKFASKCMPESNGSFCVMLTKQYNNAASNFIQHRVKVRVTNPCSFSPSFRPMAIETELYRPQLPVSLDKPLTQTPFTQPRVPESRGREETRCQINLQRYIWRCKPLTAKLHFHMCSVDFRRMAAHSALWKEAKKDKIFLGEFSEAIYLSHLTLIKSYHAFSSCLYLFCHCMHQFIFQRGNWTPFIIILLKNVTVLHCTTIL